MLPQLQAERQLLAIEANLVPHIEKADRADIIGRLTRRLSRGKPQSATEALASMPIPIIEVPKKVKPRGRTRKPRQGQSRS